MSILYTASSSELQAIASDIKDVVLMGLEREGLLKKPFTEVAETYAIVLHRRGWLGNMWKRLFGKDDSDKVFVATFVKIV